MKGFLYLIGGNALIALANLINNDLARANPETAWQSAVFISQVVQALAFILIGFAMLFVGLLFVLAGDKRC